MKNILLVVLAWVITSTIGCAGTDKVDAAVADNRATVKMFGKQLKGQLVAAMKEGGPVAAVNVCNIQAPLIAAKIGKDKGWEIARTSLKVRNVGNLPDAWEVNVLQNFETRKAAGEDIAKMEYHEVVVSNGKSTLRYMKAIPTSAACLACHGSSIDSKVTAKLDALYPSDQARGYKEGDIRGAFTISSPF